LLAELLKSIGEELLNQVLGVLSLLTLLGLSLLEHALFVAFKGPETSLTEEGSEVNLHGSHEILVLKMHHLLKEVLHEDTDHPDLLVGHETASALIKSVFSKLVLERFLQFLEVSLVQVFHLSAGETGFMLFNLGVNGRQNVVVVLEVFGHLLKVVDAELDCLVEEKVGLLDILLDGVAEQKEELEGRLTVSCLVGFQEVSLSLVKVLLDTEALHVVDAHPVVTDNVALLSSLSVVHASSFLVAINVGLGGAELTESAAGTA
jgi:hypothetical protein